MRDLILVVSGLGSIAAGIAGVPIVSLMLLAAGVTGVCVVLLLDGRQE